MDIWRCRRDKLPYTSYTNAKNPVTTRPTGGKMHLTRILHKPKINLHFVVLLFSLLVLITISYSYLYPYNSLMMNGNR